jgi:hypothetical protein
MIAQDLKSKWKTISEEGKSTDYKILRISSECCSTIYISLDSDRSRCLLLDLPDSYQSDFNSVKKDKISLGLLRDRNYIVLTLHDPAYDDHFDMLIISLYNSIKDISEVSDYVSVFIGTFYKWTQFFEEEVHERLSKNIIQGLFGELTVLKSLLSKATASTVNDLLEAWKGPYDQGHDFVLNDKDIEVKAKMDGKNTIGISSENQLESTDERDLELAVVSVNFDLANGTSIKALVEDIRHVVEGLLGDTLILLKAIRQKGLNFTNLKNYDHWRFKALNIYTYDCLNSSFPKIVSSGVAPSISGVKYNINLRDLDEYITAEEKF